MIGWNIDLNSDWSKNNLNNNEDRAIEQFIPNEQIVQYASVNNQQDLVDSEFNSPPPVEKKKVNLDLSYENLQNS
jgi:hypothetical protein